MGKSDGSFIKITGGEFRGRKIRTPGSNTHPMGERERLALFNMIGPRINGVKILDAFAGSGALGIEALSRGASEVVFVDNSAIAIKTIRENLDALGIEDKVTVLKGKVSEVLGDFRDFGVILADPPYDDFKITEVDRLLERLEPGGILVLSHPDEAPDLQGTKLVKTRTYAGAHISIYDKD